MLVTTMDQGEDLARTLAGNSVALMRGHGCVVAGAGLRDTVMKAIYLQVNAALILAARPLGDIRLPVRRRDGALLGDQHRRQPAQTRLGLPGPPAPAGRPTRRSVV